MAKTLVKTACDAYREACKIPLLSSARIESCSEDSLVLNSVWSQTNLASYKKVQFCRPVVVSLPTLTGLQKLAALPLLPAELACHTAAGAAIIRTEKEEQLVEIWDQDSLRQTYNLKDIDAHGKVYSDSEFGSLSVSGDGSKLVYIAEKKKAKTVPFLHQGEVGEGVEQGTQYDYRQDWGEQLVGKIDPVIAVLNINSIQPAEIKIIDSVPENWSPGLVKFWNSGIVGVAYRSSPRKLGKIYCTNRVSVLFYIGPEGKYVELRSSAGDHEIGITGLTLGSETGKLVWFERTLQSVGSVFPGPHGAGLRIMCLDGRNQTPYQVFGEDQPVFSEGSNLCCGLFAPIVPERCWLDEDTFFFSESQGGVIMPIKVNCKEKTVSLLSGSNENHGVTVLDVWNGYILGSRSNLVTPPHLVISTQESLEFRPVFPPAPFPQLSWKSFLLHNEEDGLPYTAFIVGPSQTTNGSLIVWPHGGPHSIISTDFKASVHFFCKLGFSVLFVNYRGSTGLGEQVVTSLLGRIGDADVRDCHRATQVCLADNVSLSRDKVFLFGGSHGGFLVTHLAGQYPDFYKGVVARNPVTNIAGMSEVTDIPDWTYNEAGLNYAWKHPNLAQLQTMWAASPVAHMEKIKAPIFLMIGSKDLRVPPSQGTQFYHSLVALGKTVRMHEYDDNHPLAKPEHDANVMISAAVFFSEISTE